MDFYPLGLFLYLFLARTLGRILAFRSYFISNSVTEDLGTNPCCEFPKRFPFQSLFLVYWLSVLDLLTSVGESVA